MSVFVVDSKGKSGGLALFWKEAFHVSIQNYSSSHINAEVYSEEHDFSWKFTGFYGNPDVGKRKESWALLKHLATFSPEAWLCTGDFNEVIKASKKKGGARRLRYQMMDFQHALAHCCLSDMGFCGPKFTWSNKRGDYMLQKSVLTEWWQKNLFASQFPQLSMEVLAARSSDHTPLCVSLHPAVTSSIRMDVFRFEAWWQCKEGFSKVV
jgi:hypothetical protein